MSSHLVLMEFVGLFEHRSLSTSTVLFTAKNRVVVNRMMPFEIYLVSKGAALLEILLACHNRG